LLGTAVGGWLACGCLLANPPDYDEQEVLAIVSRSPDSDHVEIDLDLETRQLQQKLTGFDAVVRVGKASQQVVYRWFLDYDPLDVTKVPACGLLDDTEVASPTTDPLKRRVANAYPWWSSLLEAGQCHRLSLVVTDGDFAEGGCAKVSEGASRVTNDWWLTPFNTENAVNSTGTCTPKEGPLDQ